MLGPHQESNTMSGHHVKRRDQRFKTALEHEAAREQIAFACMTDAVPARPVFDEPRAYIDDSRWYTVCPEPQPGDFDFDLCNPHSFYAMSSSGMACSTVYAARADGSDPHLPESSLVSRRTPLLLFIVT